MRKILSIVILVSMMLHCASRLGVLSHLYKYRHEIAYSAGLITEVPIAMCSQADFANGASLMVADHDGESTPIYFNQASEITLFCVDIRGAFYQSAYAVEHKGQTTLVISPYPSPHNSIFHPPLQG